MNQSLSALERGGLLLGMSRDKKQLYYNAADTHSVTIGATRSGKTRHVVLGTICLLAMAGESIVASDPKGELYLYTYPFLERLGYDVVVLDFKNQTKGNQYNFLQPVIDAVNQNNIPLAVKRARMLTAALVQDDKTERIWTDGERSIITAGILSVVVDNREHPEFQNLTNVYHFLSNMTKPVGKEGRLPISQYLNDIPPDHPARAVIDISQIAPSKMRGSFYTSALVTLALFTDPYIYDMTRTTDWDCYTTGRKKRAVFIILPDYDKTYYPIASLFVYQHYQMLAEDSDKCGNRLQRRVNFVLDEFGNFTKIPDMATLITVGGGRGIRFNLFMQDFKQLDEIYGQNEGKIIRSNAETWIYLQTDDPETLREMSEKLGKYTIKTPSISGSSNGSASASYNLTSRDLLTSDEIGRINRPYQLVTSRSAPAVLYAPDVSQTSFNSMLGLGDEEYNKNLIIRRNAMRPERPGGEIRLWNIWNRYLRLCAGSAPPRFAAGFGEQKYY